MVLFLEPEFKERIWGGTGLKEFNYDIPSDITGECWGISAHPNGPNKIKNGKHQGKTLDQVWIEDKALFGNPKAHTFPLLTKILDANDKLSVQVHPNDDYALKHEGEYGKTECWYILDAKTDAEIIYGVNTTDSNELNEMIDNRAFDQLFKRVKVQPGDFYYVPAGTVHAIGEGIQILETQQSSDTTYRIYDYDRTDKDGNQRALHLEQSKAVIQLNDNSPNSTPISKNIQGQKYTQFVSNTFFTVARWEISGKLNYDLSRDYELISIVEGRGTIEIDGEVHELVKGDHLILTVEDTNIVIEGDLTAIISYV